MTVWKTLSPNPSTTPARTSRECKTALHALLVTGGPSAKRKNKPSLERTRRALHSIAEQSSALRAAFEALDDPAASVFANRGGVRRMLRTLEIVAKDAAERMPVHGEFVKFLRAVFKARGVSASLER
jgi:hypothetical protein